ncbi:hypothetical protein [Candidatus Enterococcus wittei]|nr:hypothetical protein [Enterococcus sp. 10A9_DIV0425]
MINKKQLKQYLKHQFKSKDSFSLKIYMFKKDRYLLITYDRKNYKIAEFGFEKNDYQLSSSDETFKLAIRRANFEFKNSHKLYVELSVT